MGHPYDESTTGGNIANRRKAVRLAVLDLVNSIKTYDPKKDYTRECTSNCFLKGRYRSLQQARLELGEYQDMIDDYTKLISLALTEYQTGATVIIRIYNHKIKELVPWVVNPGGIDAAYWYERRSYVKYEKGDFAGGCEDFKKALDSKLVVGEDFKKKNIHISDIFNQWFFRWSKGIHPLNKECN